MDSLCLQDNRVLGANRRGPLLHICETPVNQFNSPLILCDENEHLNKYQPKKSVPTRRNGYWGVILSGGSGAITGGTGTIFQRSQGEQSMMTLLTARRPPTTW